MTTVLHPTPPSSSPSSPSSPNLAKRREETSQGTVQAERLRLSLRIAIEPTILEDEFSTFLQGSPGDYKPYTPTVWPISPASPRSSIGSSASADAAKPNRRRSIWRRSSVVSTASLPSPTPEGTKKELRRKTMAFAALGLLDRTRPGTDPDSSTSTSIGCGPLSHTSASEGGDSLRRSSSLAFSSSPKVPRKRFSLSFKF